MIRDWRWHPTTRLVAGVLSVALIAGVIIALIVGVASVRVGSWSAAAISLIAIPSLVLARLFLIGAWTGEEPGFGFGPSDSDDPTS